MAFTEVDPPSDFPVAVTRAALANLRRPIRTKRAHQQFGARATALADVD
jgi:hypothetical protein